MLYTVYAVMLWEHIFKLYPYTNLPFKLWGPVFISLFSPPNSIYKPALCFDGVGIIFSFFFKYKSSGGPCLVHFYHPLYALILIYKLWGPVSISISHHLILYTNQLYDVRCLYFTLSPNTNLSFKLWGPYL